MTYESKGWVACFQDNCLFWSGTVATGAVKPYTLPIVEQSCGWSIGLVIERFQVQFPVASSSVVVVPLSKELYSNCSPEPQ